MLYYIFAVAVVEVVLFRYIIVLFRQVTTLTFEFTFMEKLYKYIFVYKMYNYAWKFAVCTT